MSTPTKLPELFGSMVFNEETMKERLSSASAEQFGELFRCTHTFHPPIFLYRIVS